MYRIVLISITVLIFSIIYSFIYRDKDTFKMDTAIFVGHINEYVVSVNDTTDKSPTQICWNIYRQMNVEIMSQASNHKSGKYLVDGGCETYEEGSIDDVRQKCLRLLFSKNETRRLELCKNYFTHQDGTPCTCKREPTPLIRYE